MDTFAPWQVVHADVEGDVPAGELSEDAGGVYVVLWRGDRPLGHLAIPRGGSSLTLTEAVDRARASLPQAPRLDGETDAVDHATSLSVSVVICTRDRPGPLERALAAIGLLTRRPDEIIVVDNGSASDATRQCVERAPDARYVHEGRPGLDRARNAGIRAASCHVIAFTDDDAEVHPEWLTGLVDGFRDPEVLAVTGLVLPAELETESQFLFETHWGFNKGYRPRTFDAVFFAGSGDRAVPAWDVGAGANMAFRRHAFDAVGLFDERLDVGAAGCSGDSEFWYRLLAEGWACRYEPSAVVFHHHRRDAADFRRQIFGYMRGHTAALLVQYERYGHASNLGRLGCELPRMYAARIRRYLKGERHPSYTTLGREILGCVSGVGYYARHARPRNRLAHKPGRPPLVCRPVRLSTTSTVSVVIPCHNQANYLGEAIDSVLAQDYPGIEVVVVDDGSTDGTCAVAEKYPRVLYVRQPNRGLASARNAGVRSSTGDILVFLDADDRLLPGSIDAGVRAFQASPESGFVFGEHEVLEDTGAIVRDVTPELGRWYSRHEPLRRNYPGDDHYAALLKRNYIAMHAAACYRRDVVEAFGGFDESLEACEDYDLYLRIAWAMPVSYHGVRVAQYRRHDANMSNDDDVMLRASLGVLERQRKRVASDPLLADAYRAGVTFWKEYYGRELAATVVREVEDGGSRAAAVRGARTLLRYAPELLPMSCLVRLCASSSLWSRFPSYAFRAGIRRGRSLLGGGSPS